MNLPSMVVPPPPDGFRTMKSNLPSLLMAPTSVGRGTDNDMPHATISMRVNFCCPETVNDLRAVLAPVFTGVLAVHEPSISFGDGGPEDGGGVGGCDVAEGESCRLDALVAEMGHAASDGQIH